MNKIEVFFREEKNDSESNSVKNDILADLGIKLNALKIVQCYYIEPELTEQELEKIASNLFCDLIVQEYKINSDAEIKADWLAEIKLLPGTTDNTGNASMIGVKDLLKRNFPENESIKTSKKYFFSGGTENEINKVCREMLANEIIESFEIKKSGE
ncbi:MAG: hypothetical protein COT90_00495 [Candidatus Diapherotrites archaeon CG10_big_fil_rev_8_21_14_0_10_31_34]|nr:MAG: hypothetical protein COT90_00495 [Candidatus Diapherotrites archaeon CG10_big_fil_rev_8_21_14_0_10_31_34]